MKTISLLLIMCLLVFCAPAFAGKGGEKGTSEQAQEHASDEAIFNRASDWFATVGKSEEEKQEILAERKAKRAAKRAEKEAKKAAKKPAVKWPPQRPLTRFSRSSRGPRKVLMCRP